MKEKFVAYQISSIAFSIYQGNVFTSFKVHCFNS